MDPAYQSWAAMLGWGTCFTLFALGVGLMFSNPTNIERPIVVGVFTTIGAMFVGALMWHTQAEGGPFGWSQVFGYVLVGIAMFGWGRLMDYVLGPSPVDREADKETLGAHVSD